MESYFEPDAGQVSDPSAVVSACIEEGSRSVLLDEGVVPDAFFDLSTRVAGELLHALGKYGLRLAVVVPDPDEHSLPFQDFAREASRGSSYRFFRTRAEALAWLGEG